MTDKTWYEIEREKWQVQRAWLQQIAALENVAHRRGVWPYRPVGPMPQTHPGKLLRRTI
jgi:hypothetical protein